MKPCEIALEDHLFGKIAILVVVLLTFHGSTIANSIPGELEKPALPSSGILNPTRREGMIWRNPFAKCCETGHRPQQSVQGFLPMRPCPAAASERDTADRALLHILAVKIESSCSWRLSVAKAVPKNRALYPGFGLPTFVQGAGPLADHSQRLTPTFGLAKCRSVPALSAKQTCAGFTGVSNQPKPGGIGSQDVFLGPGRQTPGFPLGDTRPADPAGSQAQPLTTPRLFAGDVLHDQERIWKFPWGAAHGRHWKPALAFTIATAGLVELDPHYAPYFRRTSTFSGFNDTFSSLNTGLGEGLFPVGFFLAGRLRKDTYMERTALLAGEALADAEIASEVIKNVARRSRPRQVPPDGNFADTWFEAGGGLLIKGGSFPSGHAIGAFSMATIIAELYRRHRWVPLVAYGLAGLVGFSRITLQEHFPSDIFAGAVFGYAISHYVVLRKQD
jgi:membrane-associated phospholipid phosphatase